MRAPQRDRRAAIYADRFNGAKPGERPIHAPRKIELIKTAKELGPPCRLRCWFARMT
jgi:hypothetical protein